MGIIALDKTMSLDGFIAGPNDDVTRLFAWYGDAIADTIADLGDPLHTTGAVIMGKHSFNLIDNPNGWVAPDGTAFPWPVFVLTHEPRASVKKGATMFTFVTDGIESAIKQARAVAGDKNIGLHGSHAARQCLKAGLLDEIHIHLVPVLLGKGVRLFDHLDTKPIELERTRATEARGVTHLSFRVVK